jgi:hypothetical protein
MLLICLPKGSRSLRHFGFLFQSFRELPGDLEVHNGRNATANRKCDVPLASGWKCKRNAMCLMAKGKGAFSYSPPQKIKESRVTSPRRSLADTPPYKIKGSVVTSPWRIDGAWRVVFIALPGVCAF